jgi:TetR/AcrR family transcriptional regulator
MTRRDDATATRVTARRPDRPATRMQPAGASDTRRDAVEALLDAAERLLVEQGHAAITTRRLAKEAGVNHGLVHYYFGSMEEVMVQVLERFTERLIERQRAMYAADVPFLEKWRTAWGFQEQDLAGGYSKVWLELQALSWNRPELRARIQRVNDEWRRVLTEAYSPVLRSYGVGDTFPIEAVVTLVMTMAQGYALERLAGIDTGHDAMLGWIEGWLGTLERKAGGR